MSVSKKFENIPRSPAQGATGPVCNFFLLICKEIPGKGHVGARGTCRPPLGRLGGPTHRRHGGPVAPLGRPALPPIKPLTPFPPHLSPKIPPKIQKKRVG